MTSANLDVMWARAYGGTLLHAWRYEGNVIGPSHLKALCNQGLVQKDRSYFMRPKQCAKCIRKSQEGRPK